MSQTDVNEQIDRREHLGIDALLRKTVFVDFSVPGMPLVDLIAVPADKRLIVRDVIISSPDFSVANYSQLVDFKFGFNPTGDDMFNHFDLSPLTDATKGYLKTNVQNGDTASGLFLIGSPGQVFKGGPTGNPTSQPGKKIRVSGNLIQRKIAAFNLDVAKITVSGLGTPDDQDYVREPGTTNGKRRFADVGNNGGYFEWQNSPDRWVFFSGDNNAELYESFDDTNFPTEAGFTEIGNSNPAAFSLSLSYDTYSIDELIHAGAAQGKRAYRNVDYSNYLEYDGNATNAWVLFGPGDVPLLQSETTNASDPTTTMFLLPDSPFAITITEEPSPILGDYWECGSTTDQLRYFTKNGVPFGGPIPKLLAENDPAEWNFYTTWGNPIYNSQDNVTVPNVDPVGAVFTDVGLTGAGVPTITELSEGPGVQITILYFFLPA